MTKPTRHRLTARIGVAALGAGILAVVGTGAATAAPVDDGTIDVSVEIQPDAEAGELALTVATGTAALTEGENEGDDRVFRGTLPTVTVTDTRVAADVDPADYWYVVGSISDFAGDGAQPDILADEAFGWYPSEITGLPAEDPFVVTPGDPVDPGEFRDEELLSIVGDNSQAAAGGTYSSNADLVLQTPRTVAPGKYSATLTLSLFEDTAE